MGLEKTRILVLIKGLGLGGAERLIADAAEVWDKEAFEYRVAYVLPWKDQLVSPIEATGVQVTCIGSRWGMSPLTPWRLHRLIADFKPDVIHAHLPSAGVLARLTTSIPIVYTEHNIAHSYRQPTRFLNRATYGRNAAVIAVSQLVAEALVEYPGPEPNVVPNGIPPGLDSEATDLRTELGLSPDEPLFVHVGNIRPHKGHSNLIAATAILARTRSDVKVASAGAEKFEGDLERVRAEAQNAGVGDVITFLGRRDDARNLLAAADVVVNPSDFEGLPVSLLEALSFGRVVVATDVGGVANLIQNGVTGLLVPPADPTALAGAMERALTDPEAPEWGRRGQQLVIEHHGIATMVERYESVYREVLHG